MVSRTQSTRRIGHLTALAVPALLAGCIPALPVPCSGNSCPEGQFCEFEEGSCGNNAAQGTCTPRPDACTADFSPVCGCDGLTYSNPCMAAAAGMNVVAAEDCGVAAATCGGIDGVACPDGQFCKFEIGVCCCDPEGLCEPIPDACAEIFQPVCGCDGSTYSNECEAATAGVSVDHEGECRATATVCGGIAGVQCPEGEYCRFQRGACCCDVQGVCEPNPEGCLAVFDPVCGCDGVTYGNECEAARAGVTVDRDGPCES